MAGFGAIALQQEVRDRFEHIGAKPDAKRGGDHDATLSALRKYPVFVRTRTNIAPSRRASLTRRANSVVLFSCFE
jgi:hypothetical protein